MAKDNLVLFGQEFDGVEHLIVKDEFGIDRDFIRPNNIMVISENNTYPVADCKQADVQLPPQTGKKLQIAENGEFTPDTYSGEYYNEVVVQMATELTDEEITITENGTYKPSTGHMFSKVEVDVPCDVMVGYDEFGNPVTPYVDPITGKLEVKKLPDHIKVTVNPTKMNYLPNETIDYSGIEVRAYNKDDTLWTEMGYTNGIIPFNELIFPVSVVAPIEYNSDLTNGQAPISFGIPYIKQISNHAGDICYNTGCNFWVQYYGENQNKGTYQGKDYDFTIHNLRRYEYSSLPADYVFGFVREIPCTLYPENNEVQATQYKFRIMLFMKNNRLVDADLIMPENGKGIDHLEWYYYDREAKEYIVYVPDSYDTIQYIGKSNYHYSDGDYDVDGVKTTIYYGYYSNFNSYESTYGDKTCDFVWGNGERKMNEVEYSDTFNENVWTTEYNYNTAVINIYKLLNGEGIVKLIKSDDIVNVFLPTYTVINNEFQGLPDIVFSTGLYVVSNDIDNIATYSMATTNVRYTMAPSQNSFLFIASSTQSAMITMSLDKYNNETRNKENAESYIWCTREYVWNNKKVYYTCNSIPVSGNISDAQPVALNQSDVSAFYNNADKIAWLMCYGNMSGNYDATLSVPVQWKRPSDRKVLETTLDLQVNVG